jgi:mannose-1-phosphate guanylyltransferase
MKAFILAAGNGERLRPLTDAIPKCLVPIQGVPILGVWLDLCRRHHIDEVLVNTHSHADAVEGYLHTHSDDIKVHVTNEKTLLGSAGTLLANREWIDGEREFFVFYADVLTNANITDMLNFHHCGDQIATMGVYLVSNPHECGIVTIDRDLCVREFAEKPAHPTSNLAFSGILLATPAILDVIPHQTPADLGFHVLPKLVGRLKAYPISEYLVDIGTPASHQYAQATWRGLEIPRAMAGQTRSVLYEKTEWNHISGNSSDFQG